MSGGLVILPVWEKERVRRMLRQKKRRQQQDMTSLMMAWLLESSLIMVHIIPIT